MSEVQVGVRQLKSRLSQYLRQVKEGQTVIVTEYGRPVGRIVPVARPLEERLAAMVQAGQVAWSGKKLPPMSPVAQARGGGRVADLLVEGRE